MYIFQWTLRRKLLCADPAIAAVQEVPVAGSALPVSNVAPYSRDGPVMHAHLLRREISSRGLTPQQKADVACRQLPKGPPSLVDKYCRRAYAGQWSSDGDLLFTTCQDWKIRIYTHDSKTLTRRCIINAKYAIYPPTVFVDQWADLELNVDTRVGRGSGRSLTR